MTIRSHSVAGERRYADLLGVRVWLLAAAAALVGAMVGGGPDRDRATPWLIAAALLGVVSVRLLEAGAPPSTGSSADTERMQTGGCAAWHPRGHERRQVAGWGLLALGAFAATAATAIVLAKGPDVLATTTWVVALASVALGATLSSARHSERRHWQHCMSALPELTCLAAVVAIAVWLRLPDLVGVPPNVHPDEGGFGNGARQILAGKMPIVFPTGWFDVPASSFAISALVMLVFGNDLFGLRMASVIEGALTVVVLYLLGRRLWGARPALVAAALLSIAAWHVHFSRMGSQHMQAPLAILLVLYFLIRGVQDALLLDWVLCGFAIGLSFEVYYAARVAPALVLAYLGYRTATEKREFVHTHGLGLLALVFGAFVFVAPMTVVYARDPQTLDSRTDAV
ncbi:MAG: glycosyltransferase family 39 protein, partial [Chloroflexi bacterium]|nr:glycosyltransferase family 39 protein [Chloroflexota bacterium]